MDRLQLKKSILLSQKSQQNYDPSREIPREDLEVMETALSQCPSKQNLCFYDAHMITDRAVIEKIHEHTPGIRARAPQMMGNLCVVFTEPRKKPLESQTINPRSGKEYGFRNLEQRLLAGTEEQAGSFNGRTREMVKEHLRSDQQVALGIAAGYLNLVAAQLGYRSGSTKSFHAEPIMEILGIEEKPLLIMGIGFNNAERDRREHQLDPDFTSPARAKMPIGITWHK